MDIKFNTIQAISPVKKYQAAQRTASTAAAGLTQATDEVNVSANGKLFASAIKEANAAPEVREARVSELRQQIQSGTYSVESRDIAAKMLGSLRVSHDF